MWNEDEVKGKVEQAKGAIKKKAGEVMDDPQLEDEGAADQAAGEIRETVGGVSRGIEQVADKAKKALDR